jgi:hypothetical protein
VKDNSPDKDSWSNDFFLRRMRLIFAGQVHPKVKFFVDTDQPNWGKNGDWSSSIFTQDAYVDFDLFPELKVAGGQMLLPFSHHNRQSAATLNTLDYHVPLIKFPDGTHKVWRDAGVEARGLLFQNHLDYRLGIFNSMGGKKITASTTDSEGNIINPDNGMTNPDDMPRFTGRIQANILDPEDTFFYNGIYFGKKKIVSFGLGYDIGPDIAQDLDRATGVTEEETYVGLVGDAFVDLPVGKDMEVVGQASVYDYDKGDNQPGSGTGFFAELGYRYLKWEPVVSGEWFDGDGKDANMKKRGDLRNVRLGLNYWFKEHAVNFKAEYGYLSATDDIADGESAITFQTQVLF